jgi:hypothetical protein
MREFKSAMPKRILTKDATVFFTEKKSESFERLFVFFGLENSL